MKEFTVIMNAQITFIHKESDILTEESIRGIDGIDEKVMADVLKRDLKADDVVVSDMKLFVLDKKKGENHETDK